CARHGHQRPAGPCRGAPADRAADFSRPRSARRSGAAARGNVETVTTRSYGRLACELPARVEPGKRADRSSDEKPVSLVHDALRVRGVHMRMPTRHVVLAAYLADGGHR